MPEQKVEIQLPLPLPQQEDPLESEARFKVWRWGRRSGKTGAAIIASTVGHGAKPNGKGFLTGGHILWVARDYTQADVAWRKQFRRRFRGKAGFNLNEQHRRIELASPQTEGSFKIASAENIDSERGDFWDGVVIDEGAFLNLEDILLDVVRPGLADRKGWLIVMSTTKMGSYFNTLCEEIMQGKRSTTWAHWYRTAYDNPKIEDDEIRALMEDYTDPVKLDEEMWAKLLVKGGLAFREWNEEVHVVEIPWQSWWVPVGAMDWGFTKPGYIALCGLGEDRDIYVRHEYKFSYTHPKQVGINFAKQLVAKKLHAPLYIMADAQMWVRAESVETTADKVMDGLEEVLGDDAPALIPAPKGPGSRVQGVVAMHEHLWYETENANGIPDEHEAPKIRFHPSCEYGTRTISRLPRDPRNSEDVDSTAEDHAFDALKGLLLSFRSGGEKPAKTDLREDVGRFPGLRRKGGGLRERTISRSMNQALYGRDSQFDGDYDTVPGSYVIPT